MITPRTFGSTRRRQGQSGFTMVEIAFSLAIIGFALVAIIGVLPMGLDVQKNNRRETIINQDASYFTEAIRNGGRGLDDLTNYVATITNFWTRYDASGTVRDSGVDSYTNASFAVLAAGSFPGRVNSLTPPINDYRLHTGARIIGILSTPKYTINAETLALGPDVYQSNYVVAYCQALSGAASEKVPQANDIIREGAFGYRMVVEVMPFRSGTGTNLGFFHPSVTNYAVFNIISSAPPASVGQALKNWTVALGQRTNASPDPVYYLTNYGVTVDPATINVPDFRAVANNWLIARQTTPNLYDLRLLFRWPLLPGARLGNGRQTYRAMLSGSITNLTTTNRMQHFIGSQNYARFE